MKVLFGNFDFEHELAGAGAAPRGLSASVRRINAELAGCLAAMADDDDCLWLPEPVEPQFARHLATNGFAAIRCVSKPSDVPAGAAFQPWGWTQRLRTWAAEQGWQFDAPDPTIVAAVNAREFSSNLELEWNVGLPLARKICTEDEFLDAVVTSTAMTPGWVVKASFGMSGRERCLGFGEPREQHLGWVRRRLIRDHAVYFEPWVHRLEEVGLQFTIPRAGAPVFDQDTVLDAVTPLLSDSLGQYCGSRIPSLSAPTIPAGASGDGLQDVLQVVSQAATRIQALGYFGPVGFDAMKYRSFDGQIRWRPLQDINARLTMGRLALGLRRFVAKDEHASWLHIRCVGTAGDLGDHFRRIEELLPAGVQAIRTSPFTVGGTPNTHGSILLKARSADTLRIAEAALNERRTK